VLATIKCGQYMRGRSVIMATARAFPCVIEDV
jgi:hypothetical protein